MPQLIIDDTSFREAQRERLQRLDPDGHNREPGCYPSAFRYGQSDIVTNAQDYLDPIPRSKWKDLINQGAGQFLQDLKQGILPPHDQGQTNYCWAHGSLRTVELTSLFETGVPVLRSAESIAVPVTNGHNRGGTPDEAMARMISHGACRQELWPLNDLDTNLWTPQIAADAKECRLLRWLQIDTWEMQVTCCFHRLAVAAGLRWWSHLICQHTPVILPNGEVGLGSDNSWGADYGEDGYFILNESKGTADLGCFAPITSTWPQHQDILNHG
jgi:hypothetical protein